MSSRFEASTSVIEIPGIEAHEYALLRRLRVHTWGDLVALESEAQLSERPRVQAGDAEALDRVRGALGLPALRRSSDLLPIDAWGGLHVWGARAGDIRAVVDYALVQVGLRSRPFASGDLQPTDLKVFSTLGPDRVAIAPEGAQWVAVLSERLEGSPVDRQPLLEILRTAGAHAVLAYRYIPDTFGTPPVRDLLLVGGEARFAWRRGDDPRVMARTLAALCEEPEAAILAALDDDEPFRLADAIGLEHLGFRPYIDEALARGEEPDVIEYEAG